MRRATALFIGGSFFFLLLALDVAVALREENLEYWVNDLLEGALKQDDAKKQDSGGKDGDKKEKEKQDQENQNLEKQDLDVSFSSCEVHFFAPTIVRDLEIRVTLDEGAAPGGGEAVGKRGDESQRGSGGDEGGRPAAGGALPKKKRRRTFTILKVPEIQLRLDWSKLLLLGSPVNRILAKRPELRLFWKEKNLVGFQVRGSKGAPRKSLPPIDIEGLKLILVNAPNLVRPETVFDLENLHVGLVPDLLKEGSYRFRASLNDDVLGDIDAHGTLDSEARALAFTMEREGFDLSKGLIDRLKPDVAQFLQDLVVDVPEGGRASLQGTFRTPLKEERASEWSVRLDLRDAILHWSSHPVALEHVHGTIRYEGGRFRAEDLLCMIEGGAADLSFDLPSSSPKEKATAGDEEAAGGTDDRPGWAHARIVGLELTDDLVARLAKLPDPCPDVGDQLMIYRVRGPVDLVTDLKNPYGSEGQFDLDVEADLRRCTFLYDGDEDGREGIRGGIAPVLRELVGHVSVTLDGLLFEDVESVHGLTSVQASGDVRFGRDEHDVRIGIAGLTLDDETLTALDPKAAEVLRQLGLEGLLDVGVRIHRTPATLETLLPDVRVRFEDAAIEPEIFPYRLTDLSGSIVLLADENKIELPLATGRHGKARVKMRGTARLGEERIDASLRMSAEGVQVDEELIRALDRHIPGIEQVLSSFKVRGTCGLEDLRIDFSDRGGVAVVGTVLLDGLSLEDRATGLELRCGPGVTLRFGPRGASIDKGSSIFVQGLPMLVEESRIDEGGLRIVLVNDRVALDEALLARLRPVLPALASLEGTVLKGDASVRVVAERKEARTRLEAHLELRDTLIIPAGWKDARLEDVECSLDVDFLNGSVVVDDMLAEVPTDLPPRTNADLGSQSPGGIMDEKGVRIQVGRMIAVFKEAEPVSIHLENIAVVGIPLSEWILSFCGMSEKQVAAMDLPRMAGLASLHLESLQIAGDSLNMPAGAINIRSFVIGESESVLLSRARLEKVLFVKTPRDLKVQSDLAGANLRVLKLPIDNLRAKISGDARSLRLTAVSGVLHGEGERGAPFGFIEPEGTNLVFFWKDGRFRVQAAFKDVDMAGALGAFGQKPKGLRGQAIVQGYLEGVLGHWETYRGRGRMRAGARGLLELPLFLRILNVLTLLNPAMLVSTSSYTRVNVDWQVEDQRIELEKIELLSPSLDFKGKGFITFDGIISVSLGAQHKSPVPILSAILSFIPGVLLGGVEIEGPIESPQIRGRAFSGGDPGSEIPKGRVPITKPPKW